MTGSGSGGAVLQGRRDVRKREKHVVLLAHLLDLAPFEHGEGRPVFVPGKPAVALGVVVERRDAPVARIEDKDAVAVFHGGVHGEGEKFPGPVKGEIAHAAKKLVASGPQFQQDGVEPAGPAVALVPPEPPRGACGPPPPPLARGARPFLRRGGEGPDGWTSERRRRFRCPARTGLRLSPGCATRRAAAGSPLARRRGRSGRLGGGGVDLGGVACCRGVAGDVEAPLRSRRGRRGPAERRRDPPGRRSISSPARRRSAASFTVTSALVSRFRRCRTGFASAGTAFVSWKT